MADYVELSEVKDSLELSGEVYADDDLRLAISAASRVVEAMCGRRFDLDDADQTRSYVPYRFDFVPIDDLVTVTSIDSDLDETGSYDIWAATDYRLEPLNNALDGWPFTQIRLTGLSDFGPFDQGVGTIRITGRYGWPEVPDEVKMATKMLASRLLKRVREAPLGIAGMGVDGIAVRVSRSDPDVLMLLAPFSKASRLV